jgi:hypothetical protein
MIEGIAAGKIVSTALSPALSHSWKLLKPHLARRRVSSGDKYNFDSVSKHLDAALDILGAKAASLPQRASIAFQRFLSATPPAFALPYVQDWINDPRVRAALKQAVTDAINGQATNESETQAARLFEEIVAEPEHKAAAIIEDALQFLGRTIEVELSISEALLIDAIASVRDDLSLGIDSLSAQLSQQSGSPASLPRDVVDPHIHQILDRINKRRFFGIDATEELQAWADRCNTGDIQHSSDELKLRVFRDFAAELARKGRHVEAAQWLNKAGDIHPTADLRVDRCRLLIYTDRIPEAISILQTIDSPDATVMIIEALSRRDGVPAALSYYETQVKRVDRLTSSGLLVLANKAVGAKDWDAAYRLLYDARDYQIVECPAILSVRGQLGLAMSRGDAETFEALSESPIHPITIQFSDDPEKVTRRVLALSDFTALLPYTKSLSLDSHHSLVEENVMWLRLTHPDSEIRDSARIHLSELLADVNTAPRFVKFGIDWNVKFDTDLLIQHLENRKILNGLLPHEVVAVFLLVLNQNDPEKILQYIKTNREQLDAILHSGTLLVVEAEALAISGRPDDANRLLLERKAELPSGHFTSVSNRVAEITGGDALVLRRNSFAATGSDNDRRQLIDILLVRRLYSEASSHLVAMFEANPSTALARTVCQCYTNSDTSDELIAFTERNTFLNLLYQDDALQEFAALAALYKGDIIRARSLAEPIKNKGQSTNARTLWVTASIEVGDWSSLYGFISSECEHHASRSNEELINALHIGAVIGFSEIEQLLDIVAERGLSTKNIPLLLAAYTKAVELGLDRTKGAIHNWMTEAIHLSGPTGPIKQFTMRETVDELKAIRSHSDFVTDMVVKGDAPLAIAVGPLNMSLTGAVAGNLLRNRSNKDWRRKSGLPLFSGNRIFGSLPEYSSVTMDRTALLVLATLGFLRKSVEFFPHITLAQGTLSEFLHDLVRERFHQPSRVSSAKDILNHLATGRLRTIEGLHLPIPSDTAELGEELAALFANARATGGVVIVSPPIHKVGSFMEEIVEIDQHSDIVAGLAELLEFLVNEGLLTEKEEAIARDAFGSGNVRWERCAQLAEGMTLYLDNLAADRLNDAELIPLLSSTFKVLNVHTDVRTQAEALVEHNEVQRRVREIVSDVRSILAEGVASGKITFGPSGPTRDGERAEAALVSITNLLNDPGTADICISDDRAINKHATITDRLGRSIPIVTTPDVLTHLLHHKVISEADQKFALQMLRNSGAMFVPISRDELKKAALRGDPTKTRSAELRELSHYIDFVRMRQLIRLPEEELWLLRACLEMMAAIRNVWDEAEAVPQARAAASRLLDMLPDISSWGTLSLAHGGVMGEQRHLALRISYFSNGVSLRDSSRLDSYHEWVESSVVAPIRRNNEDAWSDAVKYGRSVTLEVATNLRNELGDDIDRFGT